jgi:hypothetical protein
LFGSSVVTLGTKYLWSFLIIAFPLQAFDTHIKTQRRNGCPDLYSCAEHITLLKLGKVRKAFFNFKQANAVRRTQTWIAQ